VEYVGTGFGKNMKCSSTIEMKAYFYIFFQNQFQKICIFPVLLQVLNAFYGLKMLNYKYSNACQVILALPFFCLPFSSYKKPWK